MSRGSVVGIFIGTKAGDLMHEVTEVYAEAGNGLVGDRYHNGNGSFNKGAIGRRQVTLINAVFFPGSGFVFQDCRRNIITDGVELMWLIGREFTIGEAVFRGLKYCDPCKRPSKITGIERSFAEAFHDRGGLVAEIIKSGVIRKGDPITPPPKEY
jgi:MOSC domain-containing protein YiiM